MHLCRAHAHDLVPVHNSSLFVTDEHPVGVSVVRNTANLPANAPTITINGTGFNAATPGANIVKLPNISASVPQLVAAIKEQADHFTHTAYQVVPYASYISLAEKRGHSEDVCTYVKSDIGMLHSGNIGPTGQRLPNPDLLLLSYTGCFTFLKWFELLREEYRAPVSMLHVPYQPEGRITPEMRDYVVKQLREDIIPALEKLSGRALLIVHMGVQWFASAFVAAYVRENRWGRDGCGRYCRGGARYGVHSRTQCRVLTRS